MVADAVKARGQDVAEKTADEFAGGERHSFRCGWRVGPVVFVGEPHLPLHDDEPAIIRDRHPLGVPPRVEDWLRAGEGPLR